MKCALAVVVLVCICVQRATTSTTPSSALNIPTGAKLESIIEASFKNFDSDNDSLIELYEFDTLIIVADSDNNGCMTLNEYKNFSAGGPDIATRIYHHFDTAHTNCLRVDDVASEFSKMDTNKNHKVTLAEFRQYYIELLNMLFGITVAPFSALNIPTGAKLESIIEASFKNFDSDNDSLIELYEFDTLIIVADSDNNGCMTLNEYKNFSAGGPDIATRIYHHFDTAHTNCLRVDDVASEFSKMDTNKNHKVTLAEFRQYYIELLNMLFGITVAPVG